MASENQDFTMFAGDTKVIALSVLDGDGTVVNLTGLNSAQFVIKKYASSTTASVTKTLGSGITNDTPTQGILQITISKPTVMNQFFLLDKFKYLILN